MDLHQYHSDGVIVRSLKLKPSIKKTIPKIRTNPKLFENEHFNNLNEWYSSTVAWIGSRVDVRKFCEEENKPYPILGLKNTWCYRGEIYEGFRQVNLKAFKKMLIQTNTCIKSKVYECECLENMIVLFQYDIFYVYGKKVRAYEWDTVLPYPINLEEDYRSVYLKPV